MMIPFAVGAQLQSSLTADWHIAGRLPASPGQTIALGFAGPVTGISNDVLLVAGGANFPAGMPWEGGQKKYYGEVYAYQLENDALKLIDSTARLTVPIAYAAVCSTTAGVFFGAGENDQGISNTCGLLIWDKPTATLIKKQLPDLPLQLTNASAVCIDNKIYVAGGETISDASDKFFVLRLDALALGWQPLPPIPEAVSHMVLLVMGQQHPAIYLMGGRKKTAGKPSTLYKECFSFDIARNSWTARASLPYHLMAGTGTVLNDSLLILLGGDRGESFHEAELLATSAAAATDDTERKKLMRQKNEMQASHPGFSREILLYHSGTNSWTVAGNMQYPPQVTTKAVEWANHVFIPGGEIRAGVRTPLIIGARININQ